MAKSKPTQDEKGRFVAGNSGNGGRPKGSRNKLGEAFIDDLYQDWQANGAETIARVREARPQDYLKVVASILPKDVNLWRSPFEDMTDEELNAAIIRLGRDLGYLKDDAPGDGSSTEHQPVVRRNPAVIQTPIHQRIIKASGGANAVTA